MAFPVTLRLERRWPLTIEVIVGIGLGAWAGLKAGRAADTGVLIFTLIIISMPVFVLGYLARFVFADELGWLPPNVAGLDGPGASCCSRASSSRCSPWRTSPG